MFTALLRRLAALCRKEFLAVLKDPASRAILIAPALVQSLLFGYAATYDLSHVPYVVLDASRSAASTELLAKLDGGGIFQRVASVETPQQIRQAIDTQQALLAIQLPPDFERRLYAGDAAPLQLILDGRNSNTAGSAAGYVGAVVASFSQQWRSAHGGSAPPLQVEARTWYNPNLETRWNLMPSLMAALSMLQTLLLTALSVAREREQGTFDQLLVTPLTPAEIMVGKALPPMLIGLTQSSLILLVALFWFQVPLAGSLLLIYAGLALFTLACVGIGLSISAVSANMQQAMLYTFVLIMPLMLLSGLTTPVRNMPPALQMATLANPLRFAIDLVQRVYLEGVGFSVVWPDLLPMVALAAVTLPLAAWLFRHRLV
ncbi:ABC transporter permease [Pseudoduganella violacea]|uniref:Transport permease protein n=1 Tax=Pseudoduganella violacea TaxID=1715466 RepID=A0A7W5FU27_9BURK|nr:ABC transporter permease [Pseudoduganella violacea]MBB3119211.1 ABC-2 type transport system permease protein [Pseudoduganella violacea]